MKGFEEVQLYCMRDLRKRFDAKRYKFLKQRESELFRSVLSDLSVFDIF